MATLREALEPLLAASKHGNVTLLFSFHDVEHNNAVGLKTYLTRVAARKRSNTDAKKNLA